MSSTQANLSVSVVIATLGGKQLDKTIELLNQGTITPREILICIPIEEARFKTFNYKNVTVVETKCRGQVGQRAIGFELATGKFVLQLDDDMHLAKDCVENLLNVINSEGGKVAVAPSLIIESTGISFYQRPKKTILFKFYYWLLNGISGHQPGKITMAGTNVGIDPEYIEDDIVEVEWVPGGCLLHRRDNLIFGNFYPFRGKAYSEDLYHSYYLKQNKVKLKICTLAQCFLDDDLVVYNFSIYDFLSFIKSDIKARVGLVRLSKKSIIRMYIYYTFVILRYFSTQIKSKFGNN